LVLLRYRFVPHPSFAALLLLTVVSLLISLFSPGQANVHRWIALGPLSWNVAFIFLPTATVAFAAAMRTGSRWAWWAALMIQAELLLQPDASQATAFAAATMVTVVMTKARSPAHLGASLIFAALAALTWTRPDPLAPVPEVEEIIQLAAAQSPVLAALCVVSLATAVACPLLARGGAQSKAHPSAIALCVYFLICSLMPWFGAFPVPLVGMGMSSIVGFWLGIGSLMTLCDPAGIGPAPAR
jgi:hypothetical protein